MIIDKTHSRNDLIELINTLNLKIVFSHVDIKKDIHDKLLNLLNDKNMQIPIEYPNVYNIKNYNDLKCYLKNCNPKKILSTKEKNDIMKICKHIINYCNSGYNLEDSLKYNHTKEIFDDMDYIKRFGDIPSVRRCCKLMNKNLKSINHFHPVLSPQMKKYLDDKQQSKQKYSKCLKVKNKKVLLYFD